MAEKIIKSGYIYCLSWVSKKNLLKTSGDKINIVDGDGLFVRLEDLEDGKTPILAIKNLCRTRVKPPAGN